MSVSICDLMISVLVFNVELVEQLDSDRTWVLLEVVLVIDFKVVTADLASIVWVPLVELLLNRLAKRFSVALTASTKTLLMVLHDLVNSDHVLSRTIILLEVVFDEFVDLLLRHLLLEGGCAVLVSHIFYFSIKF